MRVEGKTLHSRGLLFLKTKVNSMSPRAQHIFLILFLNLNSDFMVRDRTPKRTSLQVDNLSFVSYPIYSYQRIISRANKASFDLLCRLEVLVRLRKCSLAYISERASFLYHLRWIEDDVSHECHLSQYVATRHFH